MSIKLHEMREVYAKRRNRVRELMLQRNLDALFITDPANRYYLSGFEMGDIHTYSCGGHLLLTRSGKDVLFTDSRFVEAAKRIWDENNIVLYASVAEDCNAYLQKQGLGSIGIEERVMSVAFYTTFSQGIKTTKADGIVEEVRAIKEPMEVEMLKTSVALNHECMQYIEGELKEGITERDIAWKIEQFYKERGASHLSFSSIVGFGKNGALPHYAPEEESASLTLETPVLIDCGAVLNGYCSDQTRCFWFGNTPSSAYTEAYHHVQEAQRKSIEAIRAGVSCHDIFMVAWNYFVSVGVENYFTHGLGHGVGVAVHEEPRLRRDVNTVLKENMIVTVEPGLYYPQWGGIRLEYMVRVCSDGCEIL